MGPDAARYLLAGDGVRVARPFHLRWLLPLICGADLKRWRIVWLCSWPVLFAGSYFYATGNALSVIEGLAVAVAVVALPGVLGPQAVRPVGVDLPAMAVTAIAAALMEHGFTVAAVVVVCFAAMIKETSPVWCALWCWNPLLLVALVVPAVRAVTRKAELDEVTRQPHLRFVYDHPVRSALAAHSGAWRNARLWVEPWGGMLLAVGNLNVRLIVTLMVAHAQTLVATDTVRLVQTAAGPVVAVAAVQVLPLEWVAVVPLLGLLWWRTPETV